MRGVFAALFVPVLCPVLMCATWSVWKEVANQEVNGPVGVQDQVKTRPGNLLTPLGVNTLSGFTHEKGGFWGGVWYFTTRVVGKYFEVLYHMTA